ncbi:MAG: AMP-binding protein [Syntrophorhabdaceae bacterium]|nr:AMP-binding protein [Syntrophorhabdaceae bacterium]
MVKDRTFSTIRTLIDRNAALFPHKIGFVEVEGQQRRLTFLKIKDRAYRMGNALLGLGLKKGDRVAILSQNSLEYLENSLSVPNAGLIYVLCNFRLAPPEIEVILKDSEPSALIVHEQYVEMAEAFGKKIDSIKHFIYFGSPENKPKGWLAYEELIKDASLHEPNVEVYEDDVAFLMYTSGTTGLPKGVMQTHMNLYHAGRVGYMNNSLTIDDKVFVVCPFYHSTAYTPFLASVYIACPAYLFPRWDIELFLRYTENERLTAGMLATPMVSMILDYTDFKRFDLTSWKKLWFAGAGINPLRYKVFIDTFGFILGEHHGTTETTGVTTNLSFRDIKEAFDRGEYNILESCGRASFDMEIRIVDEKGIAVPSGGIGEMIAKGPGLSKGYWRKEKETEKVFRGEWFHTEDVCSIDERGYIRVIDRLKDMIITGGENVYPAEVEKVLYQHPEIKDASVIGTPHPVWGEAVTAVVVLRNKGSLKPEEIIGFCKGKVGGYKVPKVVHIVEELPRNPSGKILKRELREMFSRGV